MMADFEDFSREVWADIEGLAELARKSDHIAPELYEQYDVKRGLRDINGNGVVCGLTEISDIIAFRRGPEGEKIPCEGELYYRGYNIRDLVSGFVREKRFGFEETAYLLLFGQLPDGEALKKFGYILSGFRTLPNSFVRDIIMKAPSIDMMNVLARSVLTLYSYDDRADDISIPNVCLLYTSRCV